MRSRSRRPSLLTLALMALLFALACNLTTTPPTPTARPETPTATRIGAPTLFPSITPLINGGGSSGGVVVTSAPPANCPPPNGWVQYEVEAGDSLSGLADATGTTLQTLIQANCLADPDTLYTGQILYLPMSPISG